MCLFFLRFIPVLWLTGKKNRGCSVWQAATSWPWETLFSKLVESTCLPVSFFGYTNEATNIFSWYFSRKRTSLLVAWSLGLGLSSHLWFYLDKNYCPTQDDNSIIYAYFFFAGYLTETVSDKYRTIRCSIFIHISLSGWVWFSIIKKIFFLNRMEILFCLIFLMIWSKIYSYLHQCQSKRGTIS